VTAAVAPRVPAGPPGNDDSWRNCAIVWQVPAVAMPTVAMPTVAVPTVAVTTVGRRGNDDWGLPMVVAWGDDGSGVGRLVMAAIVRTAIGGACVRGTCVCAGWNDDAAGRAGIIGAGEH